MKKIDDNLLTITNCMFKNREDLIYVTEEQKIKFFFIVNRLISKKYPQISQLLNLKTINNSVGLDLIFEFMKDKPYPKWIWSKKSSSSSNNVYTDDELFLLSKSHNLKEEELKFILDNFEDEVKEELKFLKNQTK